MRKSRCSVHRPPRGKTGLRAWLGVWGKVAKPLLALAVFPKGWLSVAFATLFSCGLFWGNDSKMLPGHGRPTLGRPRSLSLDAGLRGRSSEPSRPAVTREERERIALEARQHLRSLGIKRYGTFLKELKARGLSVTTSEAAELYHRVEPAVYSRAHAQVASAFGGVEPPMLPPGPSASSGSRTGHGDLGQHGLQRLRANLLDLQRGLWPLLLRGWQRTPKRAPRLQSWRFPF